MSRTAERETVTVHVNGEAIVVEGQTTGADLKEVVEAAPDSSLTYCLGGEVRHLPDDEVVLGHVRAGQNLATWSQRRLGPLLVGLDY